MMFGRTVLNVLRAPLHIDMTKRDWRDIIIWWEVRRVPFNIAVTASLWISDGLSRRALSIDPVDDGIPIITGLFFSLFMLLFALVSNAWYTLGWSTELAYGERNTTFAPRLFSFGLVFSIALIMLPAARNVLWMIEQRSMFRIMP